MNRKTNYCFIQLLTSALDNRCGCKYSLAKTSSVYISGPANNNLKKVTGPHKYAENVINLILSN